MKDYYELINEQQYETAWARLTVKFQNSASKGSFESYTDWWRTVSQVQVTDIRILTQGQDRAEVYATLTYTMKDGVVTGDSSPYIVLKWDETRKLWLIDRKSDVLQ